MHRDPELTRALHQDRERPAPAFLRMESPELRLFGIDTISIAVPEEPEEGIEAHRTFLCESPHIFLPKDVNLSYGRLIEETWVLRVYPTVFDGLEGVPVVALAEFG